MREAASLRQQRRMKQAVQFIHKDSADLLPLDGLKKLGSSKDTVSPRGRARLGMPARGGRSPSRCASLGARPWPLSLSHRPGPRSRPLLALSSLLLLLFRIPLHPASPCFAFPRDSVVALPACAAFRSASFLHASLLSSRRPCPAVWPCSRLSFPLFLLVVPNLIA